MFGCACLIAGGRVVAQQVPDALADNTASIVATEALTAEANEEPFPPAPSAANPYAGDLFTRLRLPGDWRGARSGLADRGLAFDFFATQFFQRVASGGRLRRFEYGGKLDYLFNLDAGKLNLFEGFRVNLHAETRYRTDVNNIDGLIAPSNLPMSFPEPHADITSITGLKFTQALGENFEVYLGKINTLDDYGFRYAPALGTRATRLAARSSTTSPSHLGRGSPLTCRSLARARLDSTP